MDMEAREVQGLEVLGVLRGTGAQEDRKAKAICVNEDVDSLRSIKANRLF